MKKPGLSASLHNLISIFTYISKIKVYNFNVLNNRRKRVKLLFLMQIITVYLYPKTLIKITTCSALALSSSKECLRLAWCLTIHAMWKS